MHYEISYPPQAGRAARALRDTIDYLGPIYWAVVKTQIENCLRHGPRPIDAHVIANSVAMFGGVSGYPVRALEAYIRLCFQRGYLA